MALGSQVCLRYLSGELSGFCTKAAQHEAKREGRGVASGAAYGRHGGSTSDEDFMLGRWTSETRLSWV